MKADIENEAGDNPVPITGDVIGDTAYSERFVLKILLKLANRDTLKEEIKEQSFEDELCTLWDMTAERDVVFYLQTHDSLNLFKFALPVVDSPRIIEIIIGTIANMCCQKEAVKSLIENKDLLSLLLEFIKSDDSQILNQLIRLINSCVYVADDDEICVWMQMFETIEYPDSLYFILNNSSNKELLMTALENLETLCLNCKIERAATAFNKIFVVPEAPKAVYTAHSEYLKLADSEEKLERLHIVALQVMLQFTSEVTSSTSNTHVSDSSQQAIYLLRDILICYEHRTIENQSDLNFLDILDSVLHYIRYLHPVCSPDKYFLPCYSIWKDLIPNGRKESDEGLKQYLNEVKVLLCVIMCTYMSECSDENLLNVMDDVGDNFGHIVSGADNSELQVNIANRTTECRDR